MNRRKSKLADSVEEHMGVVEEETSGSKIVRPRRSTASGRDSLLSGREQRLSLVPINENEDSNDRRRSLRRRSPNKRYTLDYVQDTPTSRRKQRQVSTSDDSSTEVISLDSEEESQLNELASQVKTATLFEDQVDVAGQRVYGFKTPKKRNSMNLLASSVQKTPTTGTPKRRSAVKSMGTPKSVKTPTSLARRMSRTSIAKTPHRDRSKLKKKLSKIVNKEADADFSASESDYVPSTEEESDRGDAQSSDEDGSSSEVSEEEVKPRRPTVKSQFAQIGVVPEKKAPDTPSTMGATRTSNRIRARRQTTVEQQQFVLQSDDYFSTHSSTKVVTSDHTLDRLNTPRLPHDQLFRLLKNLRESAEHGTAIQELHEEYESFFSKWLFLMNEGFSILLYGLGSKRNLLQSFHRKVIANQPVIVVNGFFPSLTIKDIVDAIANDILDLNLHSANFHEVIDIIEHEFKYLPDTHLFVIVHNLDGIMLRNSKAQNVLARLSKVANIHLLASIDHINTPLIWDASMLSYYNFSWWDVTSMLPYSDETAFENSLLVQNSGALALSSMKNVFQSLTANSRGIFLIIVKHQIANKGNPQYQGMLFKDLYCGCREAFLVSTDLALRAQLTEFIDHKLVKVKRTMDGAENLVVPIEHSLLQQFLEENED